MPQDTAKARRSTSVVPVNLYTKDSTAPKSTTSQRIQFPKQTFDGPPKLLYTKASDIGVDQPDMASSNQKQQVRSNKSKKSKALANGHKSERNECFMDISISKKSQDGDKRVQISRQVSGAIPLRSKSVVAPSNTPVISRQSSQDWLDRSFDHDCSYD